MNTHHPQTAEVATSEWLKSAPQMDKIYGSNPSNLKTLESSVHEYFKSTHRQELESALQPTQQAILFCIDEGCTCSNLKGYALAGSGILFSNFEQEALQKSSEFVRQTNAKVVTSHAGCGAAGIAFKSLSLEKQQAYQKEFQKLSEHGADYIVPSDLYGRDFSKELAKIAKSQYKHIKSTEMARPSNLHIARMIIVDGTGLFQAGSMNSLPKSFVISRKYLDQSYARSEIDIAISIALGNHGFGQKFTPQTPLLIIVIGDSHDADLSSDNIKSKLADLPARHANRIQVVGFDVF